MKCYLEKSIRLFYERSEQKKIYIQQNGYLQKGYSMYSELRSGRKSGIGPSGVRIMDTDWGAVNGICILADDGNSQRVYLGRSDITINSNDATDGFPLSSGDCICLPVKRPYEIYVRTEVATDQAVSWILV